MPKKSPPKRRYDSSRRKEQSRQTRLQITAAARQLFIERGYAGATIEAIAREAGVAKETVYALFGSKRRILSYLLNISVGGDDQPVHILDRPEKRAIMQALDQRMQLTLFSRDMAGIMQRAAPVFEIMRDAARTEPEIAAHLKNIYRDRLKNLTTFIHSVAVNGGLRDELDEAAAGEITWAVSSHELFRLLTVERGWNIEKYSHWLGDSLIRLLLP